ncbi:hypothetical protein M413DRAFT_233314 [Hebeloma cylindrosporum]|uniref:Uncharacterized protein n=1 Tax=Hebeloma cylindrosporum TaxID=76867 RepID=A0A0C2YD54_HEBCY|nr:hypothetical protein M413DRAFT_233314 [Hebeloma cylindrosporum h7]
MLGPKMAEGKCARSRLEFSVLCLCNVHLGIDLSRTNCTHIITRRPRLSSDRIFPMSA